MERPVIQPPNRRSKTPTTPDVLRPYEHEVARLFDRFKLDLAQMFGVDRTTAARREPWTSATGRKEAERHVTAEASA